LPAFGRMPGSFTSQIDAALEACDLLQHRLQPATTLSGGELTRAMLARALVADPDVLIVDEPIAGLDPRHALDTAARLRDLAAAGKLVIASIHDLTLAGRFASRILALKGGSVQGDGPTTVTLTPELIRRTFEVQASVSGLGSDMLVDYRALS
jgi:iron complex transport system ATP-binding protein